MVEATLWILGITAMLGSAYLLLYMFFIEPYRLRVEQVEIYLSTLPSTLDGLSICHLSDTHFTHFGILEQKLLDSLSKTRPDICVITGDIADKPEGFDVLRRVLAAINPPLGVYAVLGNGELRLNMPSSELSRELSSLGVILLDNRHVDLSISGVNLSIIGVSDPFEGIDDLNAAMIDVPNESFKVLLAHSPDILMQMGNHQVDLILAGHTHGGQVRLPIVGALWLHCRHNLGLSCGHFKPEKLSGALGFDLADCHLYISRGIGSGALRPRLLCPPELAVLRLHSLERKENGYKHTEKLVKSPVDTSAEKCDNTLVQ